MNPEVEHQLRIGELGRRVGLSPELLRAWERRYGVLRPARSAGGLRLYSAEDERRVRQMQERMAGGLSAAEAARLVLADERPRAVEKGTRPLEADALELREALERFDAAAADAVLDRMLGSVLLDTVLDEVLLPYLRELGERWEAGQVTVAQEHFASNVVRARLAALARGWERGSGPLALLACAPGELHDLPLLIFGLALRARGWRIAYLGADTPGESIVDAARELDAAVVVVSAVLRSRFRAMDDELSALARGRSLAIAGAGTSRSLAESLGCLWLAESPVGAADRVTAELWRA